MGRHNHKKREESRIPSLPPLPDDAYVDDEGNWRLGNGEYLPDFCYQDGDSILIVEREYFENNRHTPEAVKKALEYLELYEAYERGEYPDSQDEE